MKNQFKITSIILFLLVFIINLQPIFADWTIPNPISSINFLVYQDPKTGYSIEYPDNWKIDESINYTLIFPPLKQESNEYPLIYLKISNRTLPNIPLTLESIVDETIKNLNTTTEGFKLIESKNISLGDKDTNKLIYSYKQQGNIIKKMDLGFISDNNLILISYTTDLENYNKYLPTIDKMIDSIQTFTYSRGLVFDRGTIKIDNSIINVEIAESSAERQRWLTFKDDKFQSNSGMILVYPQLDYHELWLLNILYNLDIMWFDENGNLVYMIKNAKPCENILDPQKCTFKTTIPAKYIVVSSAGFIDKNNITDKSKMTYIRLSNVGQNQSSSDLSLEKEFPRYTDVDLNLTDITL